ncbi:MAG: hypothetical protein ABWJ99_01935 [Caldimicrobium sp.]
MKKEDLLKKFAWDGVQCEEELILRAMLYDDPQWILQSFSKEFLKNLFLKHIHRFERENRSFWKLLLEVSNEEIERASKENLREGCKPIPY